MAIAPAGTERIAPSRDDVWSGHGRPGQSTLMETRRITFQEIRERAYELWDRHHRPDGMEIEFWLLAERELRTERQREAIAQEQAETRSTDPTPRDQH